MNLAPPFDIWGSTSASKICPERQPGKDPSVHHPILSSKTQQESSFQDKGAILRDARTVAPLSSNCKSLAGRGRLNCCFVEMISMFRMRIARLHCWSISWRNAGKIASALFLKSFGHVAFDGSQK
jgi:hypothetical protein